MERTLLLNATYEPLATISWRKAIVMQMLGKVEVVEAYDRMVRSPRLAVRLPCVVRLLHCLSRYAKHVRYSKRNIFARDRWTCQYCGQRRPTEELTVDHVIPRAQGGRTSWENVVTCCIDCNTRKANRTPAQAGMSLRAAPLRPEWLPMLVVQIGRGAPAAWRTYCPQ